MALGTVLAGRQRLRYGSAANIRSRTYSTVPVPSVLLHVSDLHVGAGPSLGAETLDALRTVIDAHTPEVVVASGDLTHRNRAAQHREAASFLHSLDCPVLAVPGIREAIEARRDDTVAVSPIIAGKALKGPADRLMAELGVEPSVHGVAEVYRGLAATLVIDEADAAARPTLEDLGLRVIVTDTIMRTTEVATALCHTIVQATT